MTIAELRDKAQACRRRAAGLTGDRYHRELQRAQGLETEANEREFYKNKMAEFRGHKHHREAIHG
jgi:hypothetical protein